MESILIYKKIEIPTEISTLMTCPNIDFCPAKVDFQHYQLYCLSEDKWQECKYYVKYEMTPAQWKKYVGETPVRREGKEIKFF